MKEIELKYGCNPNQKPARIYMADGGELPVEVVNGRPGYINFMDALNSWQLVRALKRATGKSRRGQLQARLAGRRGHRPARSPTRTGAPSSPRVTFRPSPRPTPARAGPTASAPTATGPR